MAGQSEQDKKAMQMYAVSVVGKLLNSEPIDLKTLKTLAVSRMPSLVHNEKWLEYGPANARRLAAVADFLSRNFKEGIGLNLKFLEGFADEYLQKDEGKGILLAGVVLGMLAQGQVGPNQSIGDAPLFKQLSILAKWRCAIQKAPCPCT